MRSDEERLVRQESLTIGILVLGRSIFNPKSSRIYTERVGQEYTLFAFSIPLAALDPTLVRDKRIIIVE